MSIPHTFGDKSGSVLLGDLDYNFTTLDTRLGVVESTAVTQTLLTTSLSSYATTASVTASLASKLDSTSTLDATKLTGDLPAISGANLTNIATAIPDSTITGAKLADATISAAKLDTTYLTANELGVTVGTPEIGTVGTKTTAYVLTTSDVGKYVQVGTGGSINIPNSTFSEGDVVSIFNNTTGDVTITNSITTAYIAGTDANAATATLATRGIATVLFISGAIAVICGNVS